MGFPDQPESRIYVGPIGVPALALPSVPLNAFFIHLLDQVFAMIAGGGFHNLQQPTLFCAFGGLAIQGLHLLQIPIATVNAHLCF